MQTEHAVSVGDSRDLGGVADESVHLVVTSPPYPMIEMWDDAFADLDPDIGDALVAGDGRAAFDAMHEQLAAVWREVRRVLVPGGIACVNVGDATRKIGGSVRLFSNHARPIEWFTDNGFQALPDVLWRKPSNRATKFMGSGMVPPNAYATLEHEYILPFRKGDSRRSFEPRSDRRYESAYFWEERNRWFTDLWEDVAGAGQALSDGGDDLRERSAAFPVDVPLRLIRMFSVYGDTVLDPFWGTGTTSLAAMLAGRNSVGSELDPAFVSVFDDRVADVAERSRDRNETRLADHRRFVAETDKELAYDAEHYDFPVVTRQERRLRLYAVEDVTRDGRTYAATYRPFEG